VALNRGRHVYSVGRPSRWALAHILVVVVVVVVVVIPSHHTVVWLGYLVNCVFVILSFLWSSYVIGQTIIFLSCGFFYLSSSSSSFLSPNLGGRRLDVYHTSTHGVALV